MFHRRLRLYHRICRAKRNYFRNPFAQQILQEEMYISPYITLMPVAAGPAIAVVPVTTTDIGAAVPRPLTQLPSPITHMPIPPGPPLTEPPLCIWYSRHRGLIHSSTRNFPAGLPRRAPFIGITAMAAGIPIVSPRHSLMSLLQSLCQRPITLKI